MKIIYKGKGQGKTTELIKESAETGQYIIVLNRQRALNISKMAAEMKLHIHFPITIEEYFHGIGCFVNNVLMDDADDILQAIFNKVTITAITMRKAESEEEK